VAAIRELAERHTIWRFVYLLHANPMARQAPFAALRDLANVSLVEPLAYLPFIWLLQRSNAILTDSGGLQEEASDLGKAILLMRDVTERPEAVEFGNARLVGTDRDRIVAGVEQAILGPAPVRARVRQHLYGDGKASQRIVEALASALLAGAATMRTLPPDAASLEGERPSDVVGAMR
jgi:UDP-N-acetylglucosamine 2-epimerase (non-hydrolysing)